MCGSAQQPTRGVPHADPLKPRTGHGRVGAGSWGVSGVGPQSVGMPPPRPVMAFQAGVTGHRALPNADLHALQAASANLFRAVREEVLRLQAEDQASAAPLYQPAPPLLRCVCGAAEGADAILAEAALAEGWALVAVLAFPREEFERDFEQGPALDRFRALMHRAATVCELDGDRRSGSEPYAQVGQRIVEEADLLVAVWDGKPPRGPGGTGDVVARALDRGLPVAVLSSAGPIAVDWLRGRTDGTVGHAGTVDLPALLRPVLLPSDDARFPRRTAGGVSR